MVYGVSEQSKKKTFHKNVASVLNDQKNVDFDKTYLMPTADRSVLNNAAYDSLRESVLDFLKGKKTDFENPEVATAGKTQLNTKHTM